MVATVPIFIFHKYPKGILKITVPVQIFFLFLFKHGISQRGVIQSKNDTKTGQFASNFAQSVVRLIV